MNLTAGHSERNRKPDAYFQSVRAALPSKVLSTNLHTYGTSKHLVNTKTSGHTEHGAQWSAVKENSVKRPSFLRLDSQGECSKNDWFHNSSHAVNTYSGTLALFSGVFRHYADTCGHYPKPRPVKQYANSLNIASAVKLLCQKNDFLLPCHRKKSSVASGDGAVMSRMYPLQCRSKLLPNCIGRVTLQHTQPLDVVSSLQFQPAEQQNCSQELQYDFDVPYLSFSNLLPVSLAYVADLTDYVSTFEQYRYQHNNSLDQMSLVPFRSSTSADNAGALYTGWVRRQIRQPRYNCRRRWLRVRSNMRFQKPSAQKGPTDTTVIGRSASDCELVHSDVSSDECSNSSRENELPSSDIRHDMPQYLSSVQESVAACDVDDAVWLSHCYSDLPLPSSLCNVQYTPLQESCSFSSLFFVSGKEMEDSDFCLTEDEESDCSGFLSPTSVCRTDDVLADAMLSALPCIPFADTWVMGCFSDCTTVGFDSNFEVYVEEDTISVPCDYDVFQYSLGVHEANARWNEAYSFPADVLLQTSQRHSKMV